MVVFCFFPQKYKDAVKQHQSKMFGDFFPLAPKLSYLKCKTEARWVFLIFHFVISFYLIANINVVINLMLQIKQILRSFHYPIFQCLYFHYDFFVLK